jgi:hypothetical protein
MAERKACRFVMMMAIAVLLGARETKAASPQGDGDVSVCKAQLQDCLRGCKTNDGPCITWCEQTGYVPCTGGKNVMSRPVAKPSTGSPPTRRRQP